MVEGLGLDRLPDPADFDPESFLEKNLESLEMKLDNRHKYLRENSQVIPFNFITEKKKKILLD